MSLKSFLKSKLPFLTSGMSGQSTPSFGKDFGLWNSYWAQGTAKGINYEQELGDLRNSALLMAGYRWLSTSLNSAELQVVRLDSNSQETEVIDHPLIRLLDEPNDFYGGEELLAGLALNWLTDATAYWLLVRDNLGQIAEIWYEPASSIRPVWPSDGSRFISGYEINRNGTWYSVSTEDVLVFRNGINVETRTGQSATSCLLREYFTDQQAASFSSSLMKQGLIPPMVLSLGDENRPVDLEQLKEVKESVLRLMSGASAGQPLVVNSPAKVELLNFDYSKIGLRDIRALPEERFCAAMGVSSYSLLFGISNQASTFSNVEQYLRYDFQSYVIPLHRYIAKRIQRELLPEFGDPTNLKVKFCYDEVALLQADLSKEWERVIGAYKARILDQAEAREAISYNSDDSHVGVYYPVQQTNTTMNEIDNLGPPVGQPINGKLIS